jgi:hypothetical protein
LLTKVFRTYFTQWALKFGVNFYPPYFCTPNESWESGLTHGVMVTLLILVQSFMVRIHMGQQESSVTTGLFFINFIPTGLLPPQSYSFLLQAGLLSFLLLPVLVFYF